MERIRQEITDFRIPAYIEEILTENYCRDFMRMSIVKENGNYSFSYKPGGLMKIDISSLKMYDKLILIRNLIRMSEDSEDHLIDPESYLLEPELIYVRKGSADISSMKLMYYPDVKMLDFRYKIVLFADRIMNKSIREERDMAEKIRETTESGDMNRLKMFLDKAILRQENRMA